MIDDIMNILDIYPKGFIHILPLLLRYILLYPGSG